MFFEGSVRSTRRISFSGRRSSSSRSAASTSSLWVSSSNSATSTEIGWALTPARRPRYSAVLSRKLQSAPTRSLAERRKLTRQRWAWKPITSFASSPSWIEQRIGNALADEARHEVEVIVVHEDRRLSVCLELLGDRVGEALVHARVALLPGVLQRDVDRRRVGQLPEVVLEEPEDGVRDDVVEPVVGGLVVGDEAEAERRAGRERLLDSAAGFLEDGAVLLAHRARHPR